MVPPGTCDSHACEILGLLKFLLRLRCQSGGLGGDSLIGRGRVRRGQGGPAYSERFLQGGLWIAWYRAQINWYFSAYGMALAIRTSLAPVVCQASARERPRAGPLLAPLPVLPQLLSLAAAQLHKCPRCLVAPYRRAP